MHAKPCEYLWLVSSFNFLLFSIWSPMYFFFNSLLWGSFH